MARRHTLTYSAFLKQAEDTIKRYDMLRKGDRVLAAVSGGPDSVCMLKVLLGARDKYSADIIVANLDHGLRGRESARDSVFVKKLAGEMGLKYEHKKINLRRSKRGKKSVEENARQKRYEFLKSAAVRTGCNVIATGHTMDDQAETVLIRIIYGSSISGITGISPAREEDGLRIIRPLIRTERKAIMDFLEKARLNYVEDSSNLDVKFMRNSIRHEVLPFLCKYNPRIKRTLVNLSDTFREDLFFLDTQKAAAGKHIYSGGSKTAVQIRDIILQPRTIRKEIFKELLKRAGGDIKRLTYRHWMDVDCFLRTTPKSKSLDLPGKIRITKTGNEITFRKRKN
jgi:tRNA(Ile)-lysidine synthase